MAEKFICNNRENPHATFGILKSIIEGKIKTVMADGKENAGGSLIVNDSQRGRLTGGVTLSLKKPFVSDIRINYEKYMYRSGAVPKPSEQDKIVLEVMTRF